MNIFFLSFNTRKCAKMHGDRHVIKMILETCQLLCTCYRFFYKDIDFNQLDWYKEMKKEVGFDFLKLTHVNHPSNIWVRQRQANFKWLASLGCNLCLEKRHRYPDNASHMYEPLLIWMLKNPPKEDLFDEINCNIISPPLLAITEKYLITDDECGYKKCIRSYRRYYKYKENVGIVFYKRDPNRKPIWL